MKLLFLTFIIAFLVFFLSKIWILDNNETKFILPLSKKRGKSVWVGNVNDCLAEGKGMIQKQTY